MVYFGLDLGKRQDYSALAAVEWTQRYLGRDLVTYEQQYQDILQVRGIERLPEGMPYPDVVEHVGERVARAGERLVLAVDGTGVGVPVVDLLRKEQMGCWLLPVTITGGNGETRRDGFHGVPRRDLLQGLRVGLEKGELQVGAKLRGRDALLAELRDLRTRGSRGTDDLVFALALARWAAVKRGRGL